MTEHNRVISALADVPRAAFLPPDVRSRATVDAPLPIGYGATNSQPWTVQFMLELLHVPAGAKVLDVGSGSGWTTALLQPQARIEAATPGVLGAPDRAPFDRILVSADPGEIPVALEEQLVVGG